MKKILLLVTVLMLCLAFASCDMLDDVHIFGDDGVCKLCGAKESEINGSVDEDNESDKDNENNTVGGILDGKYVTVKFTTTYVVIEDGITRITTSTSSSYVNIGSTLTLPEPTESVGQTFEGWYVGDLKWDFDTMTVEEEMTLTGIWSSTLTYHLDGGVNSDANPEKVYTNTTFPVKLEAPSKAGHEFLGWYSDKEFTEEVSEITVLGTSMDLYAKWEQIKTVEYSVNVVTVGGMPLTGVLVYVYDGDSNSPVSFPAVTGMDGTAKFTLPESDGYSVKLDGIPVGYDVKSGSSREERYALTESYLTISLSSSPVKEGGFKSRYKLGDVMYDFTMTDVNGNVHNLSEILEDKDMVMLNFWFKDCYYCQLEFPHINDAYKNYSDKLEILAINDLARDSEEVVKGFSEYLGTDLLMPLVKLTGSNLSVTSFESEGYPTTVIIDRYGVVCAIIIGAIPDEAYWNNLFEYFTAEDYKQKLITDYQIFFGE